jgi:hypothetical protein
MSTRRIWAVTLAVGLTACNCDSGGGSDGGGGGTLDAGPTSGGGGVSTQVGSLLARGGAGGLSSGIGRGGDGGSISLASRSTQAITLTPVPGLQAKPTWTRPTVALGTNPRTFSASTTVALSGPVNGDDGATPATALWVKPGVTLTLAPTAGSSVFAVDGPVVVEGTFDTGRFAPTSRSAAALTFVASIFALAPGGALLARGEDAPPGEHGGDGGRVVALVESGIFLFGTVDARGGDGGANGGTGGTVIMGFGPLGPVDAAVMAVHTGTVDVSGGDGGSAGGAGPGGVFSFGVPTADLGGGGGGGVRAALARPVAPVDVSTYSSGPVLAGGGNGARGGRGGTVEVNGGAYTVVTGPLDASGGNAGAGFPGGPGGQVIVGLAGGPVWCEGSVDATGGDSGASSSGPGGLVSIGPTELFTQDPVLPSPAVHLAADVDASGGDGESGGAGGQIVIASDGDLRAVADAANANASDGAGSGSGGRGGTINLDANDFTGAAGPITVSVPLQASAGGSDAGLGGLGGFISVIGSQVSCGPASADGGSSSVELTGGDGGDIWIESIDSESLLSGPLAVRPGDGFDVGADGTVTVDGVVQPLVGGVYTPP